MRAALEGPGLETDPWTLAEGGRGGCPPPPPPSPQSSPAVAKQKALGGRPRPTPSPGTHTRPQLMHDAMFCGNNSMLNQALCDCYMECSRAGFWWLVDMAGYEAIH